MNWPWLDKGPFSPIPYNLSWVASPNKESLVAEADWLGYINFEPKGEMASWI